MKIVLDKLRILWYIKYDTIEKGNKGKGNIMAKKSTKKVVTNYFDDAVNDIHGFNSPEHHAYNLGRKDHALGFKFDSNPFNPDPCGGISELSPFWAQGWTERETDIMTRFH